MRILSKTPIIKECIPPYAIAVGNPARVIKYRFGEEKIKRLLKDKWWDEKNENIEGIFGQQIYE